MMKRNVARHGVGVALAALFGSGLATAADNPQLAYVPADTHLYIGTGKPYPIDALFSIMPNIPLPDADDLDGDEDFRAFVEGYERFMEDPSKALSEWGVGDELGLSLYTVGIAPVLRVAIDDGDKLLAKIDEFGENDDVSVSEIKREGGSYRLYQPAKKDDDVNIAVLVGVSENDAFASVLLDPDDLAMADALAGFVAPKASLATSGKLDALLKKWNYGDDFFSFLDIREIANTLTDGDSESGKQLAQLLSTDASAAAAVAEMRKPVCQQEISGIAEVWPMMVGGYRDLVISDNSVSGSSHAAVEINHRQLSETLQLFGGLIPGLGQSSAAIFSIGLGLDVNKLSQGFGQLSQLMSSISYQCPPLQGLNGIGGEALSGASMGVVMFSGMARGIRGISATIFDLDLDIEQLQRGQPGLDKADIAIALSADDPGSLLQTLQMMPQMSGLGSIPLDGSSVPLSDIAPLPLPPEMDAEVAVKGNNVVLFRGDQASKFSAALEGAPASQDDLLFNVAIDTERAINKVRAIVDGMDIDTSDEDTRTMLDLMNSYPLGNMDLTFDFTSRGIEYLTDFKFNVRR